jgi:hypothetical protein
MSSLNSYFLISTKIRKLFRDREIETFLYQHKFSKPAIKRFIRHLCKLQTYVYKLDTYGESNWRLDEEIISKKWHDISNYISHLGISNIETNKLLEEMKLYMQVEIDMRANYLPYKIPISKYYELKICDVQLQRELIKRNSPHNYEEGYYSQWRLIDILSEILDDIEDLDEDRKDYNCNRILIAHHFTSLSLIKKDYLFYISQVRRDFDNLFLASSPHNRILFEIFHSKLVSCMFQLEKMRLTKHQSKIVARLKEEKSVNSLKNLAPISKW